MWGTNISVFSFTGDGLISSNGNRWFRMRKLLTPAFHFEILKPYVRVFQESTDTLLVWSKLVTENLISPRLAFWKLLVRPDERKENRTFLVADPGAGPGAPLFLDETKARRAEKKIFLTSAPSPLISGFGRPPPSPFYLKVCICHWSYCVFLYSFFGLFCVFRFFFVFFVFLLLFLLLCSAHPLTVIKLETIQVVIGFVMDVICGQLISLRDS